MGKTGRRAMIKPGGFCRRSRNSRATLTSARAIRGSRLFCFDTTHAGVQIFTTEVTEVTEFKIPDLVPPSAGLRGRVRGPRQLAPVQAESSPRRQLAGSAFSAASTTRPCRAARSAESAARTESTAPTGKLARYFERE